MPKPLLFKSNDVTSIQHGTNVKFKLTAIGLRHSASINVKPLFASLNSCFLSEYILKTAGILSAHSVLKKFVSTIGHSCAWVFSPYLVHSINHFRVKPSLLIHLLYLQRWEMVIQIFLFPQHAPACPKYVMLVPFSSELKQEDLLRYGTRFETVFSVLYNRD